MWKDGGKDWGRYRLFSYGAERERKAKIEAGGSGADIERNFLNMGFHCGFPRCHTDPFFWRVCDPALPLRQHTAVIWLPRKGVFAQGDGEK